MAGSRTRCAVDGATLWLIFYLTRRLYDTAAAWWALAVAILVAPHADFQPLIIGRQALAKCRCSVICWPAMPAS
jgi:hypothetical protein